MQEFKFNIPKIDGAEPLHVQSGQSIVFLGANGAGKTRLGVHIDRSAGHGRCHRIGAHRALSLNTKIRPKNLDAALADFLFGTDDPNQAAQKEHYRWSRKPYTGLLNDYDKLLAALFADESEVSTRFRQDHRKDPTTPNQSSKIDRLAEIWNRLLPHRRLDIGANNLKVRPFDREGTEYDAGELSDGERVIFYMIGQCLLCPHGTLIVIDEPELHINKAILHLVYDEIEAMREDCAFVYITHDVDFAISRQCSAMYAIRACHFPSPNQPQKCYWELAQVPEETGLDEEFLATIVGSRQAILFVEGEKGKLDSALYRWLYPDFTVIPTGGCDAVIHSVVTLNERDDLHRYEAVGLIDYDHRSDDKVSELGERNIAVLPVSEAENLLLLPDVLRQLALSLLFTPEEAETQTQEIIAAVLEQAGKGHDQVALRKTKRRLDEILKRAVVTEKNADEFVAGMSAVLGEIDPKKIYDEYHKGLEFALQSSNYEMVLREFDDKGLIDIAARKFGFRHRKELQDYLSRVLRSRNGDNLAGVMRSIIGNLPPSS